MAYLWLCLVTSGIAFLGFSFTYFGPMLAGTYPAVSPAVHVHGWTFFLWYLLLPLQAGLVTARRITIHRTLGAASLVLAALMVGTGLVVMGAQMELARQPDGPPFFRALGPVIFMTLVLFAVFYVLAFRARRDRTRHKRLMVLASAAALGAAAFRVLGQWMGFGLPAGVAGILAPNLIVIAAILVDLRRGEGVHRVYRLGLPVTIVVELGTILLTPSPAGRVFADLLAATGRALAPFY